MTAANSATWDLPGVTAVVPAYNMARYVRATLESALNQTYKSLEIILIDDGSTDETRTIAEEIAANAGNLRVVSIANGGVARARNRGMELATTPYVAFLDADDLWHPTKIEKQSRHWRSMVTIATGSPATACSGTLTSRTA